MSSIDTSTTEAAWITTATTTSSSRTSSTKTASTITSTGSIWRHLMLVTVLLALLSGGVPGGGTSILASAEGNIGCLFAETLCLDHLEWCYDDFAFGKCLPQYGLEPEELFRRPLDEDQSRILARMLEELQGAGLGWEHPFTQCRIQGALFAIRTNTDIPQTLCASLAPDPEVLGPQSPLAFVRFTPPNEEYADEVYYPPPKKAFAAGGGVIDVLPEVIPLGPGANRPQAAVELRELQDRIALDRMLRQYEAAEQAAMRQHPPDVTDYLEDGTDLNEIADSQLLPFKADRREWAAAGASKRGETAIFREQQPQRKDIDEERALKELVERLTPNDEADFQYIYPKTSSFREYAKEHHIPKISNFAPENVHQLDGGGAGGGDGVKPKADTPNADKFYKKPHKAHHRNDLPVASLRESNAAYAPPSGPEAGLYTEGGFVYVPKAGAAGARPGKDDARTLLDNILGFTRRERLDVKKPGPPAAPPPSGQSPSEPPKEIAPASAKASGAGAGGQEGPGSKSKKELFAHTDEDHAPHSVDTEYAHVILKNPIDNWKDGSRIVAALAELLNMQGYFSHPRVDRHEVSFRVESNPDRKTAADVAKQINDSRFKNNLSRRLGVLVIQAGVGDKTKELDSVSSQRLKRVEEGPNVTHVMAYMFAGAGVAAAIVIGMTLFVIRKHDKKKDKLGGLQSGLGRGGCESSSNDYQDLCRARMASGKPGATPSDSPSGGRITALAKESTEARPPSSRSSTSSWSEEPALTNMDISTGHMVLSYMEDHLRNKGRLQREWEALCRYEAEPSARDAALQSQCAPLNRAGAPLPYDHSRVVLNHLANAEGMDYINASTITDHDPRAPAYVAAQGPMQATLAHFWQMVWEQGAVVLVALCRLQENGESACARYWPEEGAEVYHIYEVHLVSEHIWCEDYLVRSFYLKNLRTGETRTVTQFHFLSWPQGGVPTSAKALLDFRRKVNKSYRGRSCPIVVHSSNGSGRTGAYILLDLVLGRMNKGAREIDIAATLEHLRDQRAGLVATRQQFEFVLMAVAEEVHAILKALPQTTSAAGKGSQDQENGAKDGQNNGTATAKEETSKDKPVDK